MENKKALFYFLFLKNSLAVLHNLLQCVNHCSIYGIQFNVLYNMTNIK